MTSASPSSSPNGPGPAAQSLRAPLGVPCSPAAFRASGSPRRRAAPSQGRALPFVPEGASTPVTPASSGRSENAAPRLSDVDPRTLLLGLLALLAIAVVSALVGTAIARFAFGYVERANSPSPSASRP